MSPSLLDFLEHIFEECDFIMQTKQNKTQEDLLNDGLFSRAMVRSLEIIGEATKKLPVEFTLYIPQAPFFQPSGYSEIRI